MAKTIRRLTEEESKLARDNIALAKFLYGIWLKKLQKRADYGIDPDELLSQAYYGLLRAAMRYRAYGEENGYSEESIATGQYFGVFARKSIIGQMLDHLRKVDHVHTLVRSDYKNLLDKGLGMPEMSLEEVAFKADLPLDRAKRVIQLIQSRPVSLEDTVGSEEEFTVGEQIPHEDTVEGTALETALRLSLVSAYDSLSELQQFVIAGKYYGNQELPELAELSEVGLTAIRRAHTEALLIIHEALVNRLVSH